jgi:predicted HTH transcriptional regulator
MTTSAPGERATYAAKLVMRLLAYPRENEQCEFKVNNCNPQEIGEYISALANSAAVAEAAHSYLIWGVEDTDHRIVGTTFRPLDAKVGNEELLNWLTHGLSPKINFRFLECDLDGMHVVVLEIDAASSSPVQFKSVEYIRIGSYKKKLADHPQEARLLWRSFDTKSFETGIALANLPVEQVLSVLDYPSYFDLLKLPLPESRDQILDALRADRLVVVNDLDEWNVTNLGALLFAKKPKAFPGLERKAMRVVQYKGTTREETIREQSGGRGYASGFAGMINYINNLLPANEVIGRALREDIRLYPELAIRELVANALIHQDLTMTGTGPMVEIFSDRLEVTNPGVPLVDARRFVDMPPQSRNEALAAMMRRIGVCEERGSGWDKIGFQIEFHQLPAPDIQVTGKHTKVILFGHRPLTKMDRDDRVRAVYLHACLRWITQEQMTNASIRARFGIDAKNSAIATRLIAEAVSEGMVAPYDPNASRKWMRYVPYWADTATA